MVLANVNELGPECTPREGVIAMYDNWEGTTLQGSNPPQIQ
jgi:hypothetical protein